MTNSPTLRAMRAKARVQALLIKSKVPPLRGAVQAAAAVVPPAALPIVDDFLAQLTVKKPDTTTVMVVNTTSIDHVENLAAQIFNGNEMMECIKTHETYLVCIRKKRKDIKAWTSVIRNLADDGVIDSITPVMMRSLRKLQGAGIVAFRELHWRQIDPPEAPEQKQGFQRMYNGSEMKWYYHGPRQHWNRIICNMTSHSTARGHDFNAGVMRLKLKQDVKDHFAKQEAYYATMGWPVTDQDPILCGCRRLPTQCTSIILNCGAYDRSKDALGYPDAGQTRTMVVPEHNTTTKADAVPQLRRERVNYFKYTANHMFGSTRERMTLVAKMEHPTIQQQEQLALWTPNPKPEYLSKQGYEEQLQALHLVSPNCAECEQELIYGDEQFMLTHSNVARKASPDRLDNSNNFYVNNTRMVCQKCNDVVRHSDRIDILHPTVSDPKTVMRMGDLAALLAALDT